MVIYLDDEDRDRFLELLARVVDTHGVICSAYCLMANHYHLVLTTTSANLSSSVKQLNSTYGQWWNRRHDRVGHVFQSRFFAQVVQDDTHMLAVCRYIVLNPVRAKLVPSPEDWSWSSYRATAGLSAVPSFLRPDDLWRLLASVPGDVAARKYKDFVGAREAATLQLPDGPILGNAAFIHNLRQWREHASREVPRRERQVRPSLDAIFAGPPTHEATAEQVGRAYSLGYSMVEIGGFLHVHPSTVSRLVKASTPGVRPCKTCKMLACKT
jgi:REP element-mobilizing transposase RayT